MTWQTILALVFITGGSTLLGSLPVVFHRYLRDSRWHWWESFGSGVMMSASVFSLLLPSYSMLKEEGASFLPLLNGFFLGASFILLMAHLLKLLTDNVRHQRAFLFVFVMGLHNMPEGLAVGVDVAAVGFRESLPLTIAIFVQNLPEGLVTSMSFLLSGFSVSRAFTANAITALIESASAIFGFNFVALSGLGLPFLLAFSGACMMSVVVREAWLKFRSNEAATFSRGGFGVGLSVCAILDLLL